MSEAALTLGPIAFRDFEIPSAVTFGGRQRMAIQYLTTGQRVIDALGPDDTTITFSGVLSGSNASARAREIDALRTQGQPLDLSWSTFLYSVIIRSFDATFKNQWWIDYRIQCTILANPNIGEAAAALSAVTQALDSLNLMYGYVPLAALPVLDVRPMLTPNFTSANPTYAASVTASLRNSITVLANEQQRQEAIVGLEPINSVLPMPQFLATFSSMTDAASTLQYLALSRHCIGQAGVYLAQEVTP